MNENRTHLLRPCAATAFLNELSLNNSRARSSAANDEAAVDQLRLSDPARGRRRGNPAAHPQPESRRPSVDALRGVPEGTPWLSLVLLARSMLVLPVLGAVKLRRAGRMGSQALHGNGILSAAGAALAGAGRPGGGSGAGLGAGRPCCRLADRGVPGVAGLADAGAPAVAGSPGTPSRAVFSSGRIVQA